MELEEEIMELEEEIKLAHAVVPTPEQERSMDEALKRAKNEPPGVQGVEAHFDARLRMLVIVLSNGRRLAVPQEDLQGVAD